MSSPASFTIGVVCEARADQETACDLADRVICQSVDWVEAEQLDSYRSWRGFEADTTHVTWSAVARLADQLNIRLPHGRFGDEPPKPDAKAARRAVRLFLTSDPKPEAVFLIRDADRASERLDGLKQARDETAADLRIVVGVARTKRECWVLNGFDPMNDRERRTLAGEQRRLGFDPRIEGHRLTAAGNQGVRNAKRVLRALVGNDHERERQCWTDSRVETLRERGGRTGLRDYLSEVEAQLVPLFGGVKAKRGQPTRRRRANRRRHR